MLDRWFLEDIRAGLEQAERFVLIDEQRQCDHLLEAVKKKLPERVLKVGSEVEELQARYLIEKAYRGEPVLIVTTIPLDRLKFLREYCETGGKLHITHLHRYILHTVNEKMSFDLGTRTAADIRAIGLLSLGRKEDFWHRVKQGELFSIDDILSFLRSPAPAFKRFGEEGQSLFCDYLTQYCASPFKGKPAQTVADEFSAALFDNILKRERSSFFEQLYHTWLDSKSYEKALLRYLEKYTPSYGIDFWQVPPDHPFSWIDERWRKDLLARLGDREWLDEKLPLLHQRAGEPIAKILPLGYWKDLVTLLSYDPAHIQSIGSLNDAIEHYRTQFYRVDTAFRHLYTLWMAEKEIIRPLQEFYRGLIHPFLARWFQFLKDEYQENQSGLLSRLLADAPAPSAIIVGDAIAYEIAEEIAATLDEEYSVSRQAVCANYPSETANNMSSLFCGSGEVLSTREKRETALKASTPGTFTFMKLDDLPLTHEAVGYTMLYSADVDQLSETQQQNALKYYPEFINTVRQKIQTLLKCGYRQVFLVSDHGFVLTGELRESDKIELEVPNGKKFERFCLSHRPIQQNLPANVFEYEKRYEGFSYCYFSSTLNPFKTPGAYGFAHGGMTPQEVLIPCFRFSLQDTGISELTVKILNKRALLSVVGDIYSIKLQAEKEDGEPQERKLILVSVKDRQELSKSDIITIRAGEEIVKEFRFEQASEFELELRDAFSQKRLDSCPVKRQQARDLGGLL